MGAFSPTMDPHRVHRIHRGSAAATGGFLLVFGVLGAVRSTGFVSTTGPVVMGLFTNGLLSTLSLAVGAILLGAAVRSGPVASSVSVAAGALFLVSGLVNVLVLGSPMNLLAFGPANVIFSLLVGATLLILGSYGRFTGSLPADSPYARATTLAGPVSRTESDGRGERALADAERAVALHAATPAQAAGVRAASGYRIHEQRLAAFTGASGAQS